MTSSHYVKLRLNNSDSGQYRVFFPKPLYLEGGDWAVALSSMRYCGERFGFLTAEERLVQVKSMTRKYKDIITNHLDQDNLLIQVKLDGTVQEYKIV